MYNVGITQLSRYGTLGDPLPGAVDSYLDLEAGLSCLSEVQYALLIMLSEISSKISQFSKSQNRKFRRICMHVSNEK